MVGKASHSIGTSECRIPCAGLALCWMGMSCSQPSFPLQGAGLGASGALQSGMKGRKLRSGPPTLGCCGWEEGGALRFSGVSGDSLQPPASTGVTIHSPKGHHKVLFPSPLGAAAPGMGRKEAAGVHSGLPLCTEAVSTFYKAVLR